MTSPQETLGRRPETRRVALVTIVALSAVGGLLADGEATGTTWLDPLFRAGFAALVAVAATRARPWTSGVAALAALGLAPSFGWGAVAALGVAAAVVATIDDELTWLLSPLGAGLAVQVLLRLDLVTPHGAATLAATAAVLPLLVSALRAAPAGVRRWVRISGGVLALFTLIAVLGLAFATVRARSMVGDATSATRAGFEAAEAGEEALAVDLFDQATAHFDDAADALSLPAVDVAKVIPIVAQHARAIDALTETGLALTRTASEATADAPLDELGADEGTVDLAQVEAFVGPVDRAATALRDAQATVEDVDSDWFLAPLAEKVDEFAAEVEDVLPDAELAAQGLEVAPDLLGADGPRRYFILFTNPAESRGLGGLISSYGVLEADRGHLELTESEGSETLEALAGVVGAEVTRPEDYVERYGAFEPGLTPADLSYSPDLPSVSVAVDDVLQQLTGEGVDGVVLVDPVALGAFLRFTGPIQLEGAPVVFTEENAARFLLRDQYLLYGAGDPARKDFLNDVARETFERLTDGDLPDPKDLSLVLDPVSDSGRLGVHVFDDEEQAFFEAMGADGRFPRPEGGDLLSITTQNSANSKIDTFLSKVIDYRATFDPESGRVDATVTMVLRNDAPAAGLPRDVIGSNQRPGRPPLPLGTNRVFASLYSPLELDEASVDGEVMRVTPGEELDSRVFSSSVNVPPGEEVELVYRLSGTIAPGGEYRLVVAGQPLVNDDLLRVRVDAAEGWSLEPGRGMRPTRGGGVAAEHKGPNDLLLSATAARD